MIDYLRRTEDGEYEELTENEVFHDLAKPVLEAINELFTGGELNSTDGGSEFALSFDDDGDGYFWLRRYGPQTRSVTRFKEVELADLDVYFLLDGTDTVVHTFDSNRDEKTEIEMALDALARST